MTTLYIRDDDGYAWTFDGERVYCVLAELEMADWTSGAVASWQIGRAAFIGDTENE